ncbi:hypothetical protein E2562_034599 [Oryza meyeriana var. granulata]|uniref:Cytochrome P450 n=1 Tax=Oryza meyeriana var. granulata TaxID=110450 RepID=A0A6G1DSP3_9ORYZ|nr:hypothetical protein E2562_034599 [Oryza meyeriana var. granulata]
MDKTTRLESYEHIRDEEVRALLRDVHDASSAGRAVLLRDYLSTATLGVISRMVLGKKYVGKGGAAGDEGTSPAVATPEEFKHMMDELFLLSGVLNIGDFIPWLDWPARPAGIHQEDEECRQEAGSVPRARLGRAREGAAATGG